MIGLLVPVKTQDVSVSQCFSQEYLKVHEFQTTRNRLHRLYGIGRVCLGDSDREVKIDNNIFKK